MGLAEDLAQEALLAALKRWPESGVPENPGAWLMATARRRAIDHFRRQQRLERKHQEMGRELAIQQEAVAEDLEERLDDPVGDDLLRLIRRPGPSSSGRPPWPATGGSGRCC